MSATVEIGWVSQIADCGDKAKVWVSLHNDPRQKIWLEVSHQNARKFWIGQTIVAQTTEDSK